MVKVGEVTIVRQRLLSSAIVSQHNAQGCCSPSMATDRAGMNMALVSALPWPVMKMPVLANRATCCAQVM